MTPLEIPASCHLHIYATHLLSTVESKDFQTKEQGWPTVRGKLLCYYYTYIFWLGIDQTQTYLVSNAGWFSN